MLQLLLRARTEVVGQDAQFQRHCAVSACRLIGMELMDGQPDVARVSCPQDFDGQFDFFTHREGHAQQGIEPAPAAAGRKRHLQIPTGERYRGRFMQR